MNKINKMNGCIFYQQNDEMNKMNDVYKNENRNGIEWIYLLKMLNNHNIEKNNLVDNNLRQF